jgi:hypothetical protein
LYNDTVVLACLYNFGIQIYNIENITNAVLISSTFVYGATQVDVSADYKTLYVANGDLGVAVYDLTSNFRVYCLL